MSKSIPALITPSVMKWAREQACLDISVAAKRIGRPEKEIKGWEDDTLKPTLAQARKAAEVYQRALAVFYLPEPPQGFQTLRDFRHMPDASSREYSPELAQLIRSVEYHQEWMREWILTDETVPLSFVGSASLRTPVSKLADSIRTTLGINIGQQMKCRTRREVLNLWIDKSEKIGINICRQGDIDCKEARGFVLTDPYIPFIYINSDDAIVAQLFTLAHELAHIWINAPGISNMEGLERVSDTDNDRVEVFCNRVASYTLLDEETFNLLWAKVSANDSLEEQISMVSDSVKVSEEVIARRLLDNGEITPVRYRALHQIFEERWLHFKEEERRKKNSKESTSFPSPHLMRVLINGRVFTDVVLTSYFEGTLSGTDASNLLHAKINNFTKVAAYVKSG